MLTRSLVLTMRILRSCALALCVLALAGCPDTVTRADAGAMVGGRNGNDTGVKAGPDTAQNDSKVSGPETGAADETGPSSDKLDSSLSAPEVAVDRVANAPDSTTTSSTTTGPVSAAEGTGDPVAAWPVVPPPAVIDCTHRGSGRDFPVGPGQKYTKIGDVPWYDLGPGDTVRIFWRADPYKEKILISNRGTGDQPIRVCGVAGSDGSLPVLSGNGATSGPNLHFISDMVMQDQGLIVITRDASDDYYSRPGYIVVEGLALRSAYHDYSYTATDGSVRNWPEFASSVAVIGGDHITIRRCELSDSGLGLFTLAASGAEATLVREVLLEGCAIFGNGVVGKYLEHNVYSQTLGMVAQFNRFGRLRAGSEGANLKDRSAGTIVRYNYIEGSVRLMDLVDAQEHIDDALKDPRYRQTFVYGNVLVSGPNDASALIHYGGDTDGFEQNYRKGTLYLYNNTVLESANSSDIRKTMLVNASTGDEHVDLRNNIIQNTGTTSFSLLGAAGQATVGANWIFKGYLPAASGSSAVVTVGSAVITGSDPKLDSSTQRPLVGSPVIDRGVALATEAAAYPASFEYASSAQGVTRTTRGAASDFGAFEAAQ